MPGKPRGERALTDAERAARYRLRKAMEAAQERELGAEALAFLLALPEAETYSMTWESKKRLRDLQTRARIEAAHAAD